MTNEILTVKNLCKEYVSQSERLCVLKGLDLSVQKGERVCVIGKSGNGKSTLLNIVGGIDSAEKFIIVYRQFPIMIMSPHFYKGIIHFNTVISEFVSLFVFVGTVNDITVSVCNEYKYGIAP
jgi:lipoprotein-releasing system ATP-binding protein